MTTALGIQRCLSTSFAIAEKTNHLIPNWPTIRKSWR